MHGYISLSSFEEVSSEQFKSAVDDLASKGMDKLIIDLRNNGGGVVQAAKDIGGLPASGWKDHCKLQGKRNR
ncbi:MAG: S41 family peptidase [Roseburia sp.]